MNPEVTSDTTAGMTSDQILTWAIGIMATLGGLTIGHLYKLVGQVQERLEESMASQLKEIWTKIDKLSDTILEDRKATNDGRVSMATTVGHLVTRADLREVRDEMIRVISESKVPK